MTNPTRADQPSKCVFVRRSTVLDLAALSHLAAQGDRPAPRGVYLIAEVGGRIVAATSLDRREEPLCDAGSDTADIQYLLRRWSHSLRREFTRSESRAA